MVLIGTGQEEGHIERLACELEPRRLQRIKWVPYEELNSWITQADVCLGIFGDTKKAERVIPNKVFQILAAGRSLITRDSPAIRELLHPTRGIRLIAPAQPQALAAAVRAQLNHRSDIGVAERHRIIARISPSAVGRQLIAEVVQTVAR